MKLRSVARQAFLLLATTASAYHLFAARAVTTKHEIASCGIVLKSLRSEAEQVREKFLLPLKKLLSKRNVSAEKIQILQKLELKFPAVPNITTVEEISDAISAAFDYAFYSFYLCYPQQPGSGSVIGSRVISGVSDFLNDVLLLAIAAWLHGANPEYLSKERDFIHSILTLLLSKPSVFGSAAFSIAALEYSNLVYRKAHGREIPSEKLQRNPLVKFSRATLLLGTLDEKLSPKAPKSGRLFFYGTESQIPRGKLDTRLVKEATISFLKEGDNPNRQTKLHLDGNGSLEEKVLKIISVKGKEILGLSSKLGRKTFSEKFIRSKAGSKSALKVLEKLKKIVEESKLAEGNEADEIARTIFFLLPPLTVILTILEQEPGKLIKKELKRSVKAIAQGKFGKQATKKQEDIEKKVAEKDVETQKKAKEQERNSKLMERRQQALSALSIVRCGADISVLVLDFLQSFLPQLLSKGKRNKKRAKELAKNIAAFLSTYTKEFSLDLTVNQIESMIASLLQTGALLVAFSATSLLLLLGSTLIANIAIVVATIAIRRYNKAVHRKTISYLSILEPFRDETVSGFYNIFKYSVSKHPFNLHLEEWERLRERVSQISSAMIEYSAYNFPYLQPDLLTRKLASYSDILFDTLMAVDGIAVSA